MNAPCKNCNFRHLGCHDSCAKYLDWKQQREVQKEAQRNYELEEYLNNKRRRRI